MRKIITVIAVAVGLVGVLAWAYGFRVNASVSMPLGVWLVQSVKAPIHRWELVSFCPPRTPQFQDAQDRRYIPSGWCSTGFSPLLKPVAAIPGDTVKVDEHGISVNGLPILGSEPLGMDGAGRFLAATPPGIYLVKPGTVWLISTHAVNSFDSRYFGPVPMDCIEGTVIPIWISE